MLLNELLEPVEEGVNDPHIFKAVFMAGGPGSGKSYVAKDLLSGTGLKPVNSDDVYEFLMHKQDLDMGDPEVIASPQGQAARERAKQLTLSREEMYIDGRLGLIIDGTGKNLEKYAANNLNLKNLGYDTAMIFVNTSLDVAQERNLQRPRRLKSELVSKMWSSVQDNLMKFQQVFGADKFFIVDNSSGLEDPDRKENFNQVYKRLQDFLNKPPANAKAKAWITSQLAS